MHKLLIAFAAITSLLTGYSVYAEDTNFQAVNPVLQGLVDTVIAGDDNIDFAYPQFDSAQSSFAAERLKYDLTGALKNTPWQSGGQAQVTASSTYATDRSSAHPGIDISMSSTVHTDVLALLRYSAGIALRKVNLSDPFYGPRLRAHLERASVTVSLDDVYVLLQSGQGLAQENFNHAIDRAQAQVACYQTGPCGQGMLDSEKLASIRGQTDFIGRVQGWIASLQRMQIQSISANGHATQITVSHPDLGGLTEFQARALAVPNVTSLVITAETLSGSMQAHAPRSPTELNQLHNNLNQTLLGVQNGNPSDKDAAQHAFRDALVIFKKTIQGTW